MIFSENFPAHQANSRVSKKKYVNVKNQNNNGENALRFAVHEYMSISTLKSKIQMEILGKGSINLIRLRYKQQILSNNNATIFDYNIKSESTLYYSFISSMESIGMIHPYDFDPKNNKQLDKVLFEIKKAFHCKITPKLTDAGISGSYFLESVERKNIAIFKPLDEEPYAPNNPKGYVGKMGQKGIRSGIRSGEQGYREVVAYHLDLQQFHEVPPTIFVELYHPAFKMNPTIPTVSNKENLKKSTILNRQLSVEMTSIFSKEENLDYIKRGSLQMFVSHADECGNYGNSIFSIDEVHKIAILDIRILNCDRNDQNILVKKKKKKSTVNPQELSKLPKYKAQMLEYDFKLIPIDHGLSFPDSFDICQEDLSWMWWDQAEQPFSAHSLEYIKKINIEKDTQILQSKFNLREKCLQNFRLANIVLQKGAKAGLNIKEIGGIIYRPDTDVQSTIEQLITEARYCSQICLKGGNQDVIKYKIKNDNIKRQSEMPTIFENVGQEEGGGQCSQLIQDDFDSSSSEANDEQNDGEQKQNSEEENENMNGSLTLTEAILKMNSQKSIDKPSQNNLLLQLSPVPLIKQELSISSQGSEEKSNPLIKKSISLPDLQAVLSLNPANGEEKEQNGGEMANQIEDYFQKKKKQAQLENSNKEQIRNQTRKHKALSKKNSMVINNIMSDKKEGEDIFFYYFENVLDMHIEKMLLAKQGQSKGRRPRFNSEELSPPQKRN